MEIIEMKIADLVPAPYNPRKKLKPGDKEYEKLKKSILEFGYVDPVIWNRRSGNVVGGHQRLSVLLEMGETLCQVSVVDLSDEKEKALNLALNKIAGEWDMPMLEDLLTELNIRDIDMELTGFDLSEIDELLHIEPEVQDAEPQIDKAAELNKKWHVTSGDLWQISQHRLYCGDSTKKEDVGRLLGEERADIVWTDPPWNVAYGSCFNNTRTDAKHYLGWKNRTIINDNLGSKFPEFCEQFCRNLYDTLVPGGILYMAMSAQEWPVIHKVLTDV